MKRYPAYKDSEIEWIGKVPQEWGIAPIRALCYLGRGRVISNEEIANNSGDYPVYSSQTAENGIMGCLNTYDFDGEYVTWTTDGANAGTVFYRQGRFNCTNVCGTLRAKTGKVFLKYLPYVLNLGTKCYVRYDINPKLMNNEMAGIRIPLPRFDEQENISNYLDRKTAQIDELIAKKERMIELLKEERTAIINQAVTKGLNPDVEMKDSGIEWLGKVPKHWRVVPLTKYLGPVIDYRGKTPTKNRYGGVFLVTARNIKDGVIDYSLSQEYVDYNEYAEIMSRGLPRKSDVLFTTEAPLGEVANIDREKVALAQRVIKFRGKKDILDNYFLKYWLMSKTFQNHLQSLATGSTALGIKASKLNLLRATLPGLKEQEEIVVYLNNKLNEMQGMVEKIDSAINLLKEYRTSLISEVVTGKIDVRG